jgi:hypothetical protein
VILKHLIALMEGKIPRFFCVDWNDSRISSKKNLEKEEYFFSVIQNGWIDQNYGKYARNY